MADEIETKICAYFCRLLCKWAYCLDERTVALKLTAKGAADTDRFIQTQKAIRSFIAHAKSKVSRLFLLALCCILCQSLDATIMPGVFNIVKNIQKKEYVLANDEYLRLSIGNAPWPIGVTMVGIHERSARQRIQTNQIAHVLNDEQTRKWIQSIKRLMTFCQSLYPNDDPSKMIG